MIPNKELNILAIHLELLIKRGQPLYNGQNARSQINLIKVSYQHCTCYHYHDVVSTISCLLLLLAGSGDKPSTPLLEV